MSIMIDFHICVWGGTSASNARLSSNFFNVSERPALVSNGARKMAVGLEPEEPTNGKEVCMARRKKKRSYGSGCVLTKGSGFLICWRGTVLFLAGVFQ